MALAEALEHPETTAGLVILDTNFPSDFIPACTASGHSVEECRASYAGDEEAKSIEKDIVAGVHPAPRHPDRCRERGSVQPDCKPEPGATSVTAEIVGTDVTAPSAMCRIAIVDKNKADWGHLGSQVTDTRIDVDHDHLVRDADEIVAIVLVIRSVRPLNRCRTSRPAPEQPGTPRQPRTVRCTHLRFSRSAMSVSGAHTGSNVTQIDRSVFGVSRRALLPARFRSGAREPSFRTHGRGEPTACVAIAVTWSQPPGRTRCRLHRRGLPHRRIGGQPSRRVAPSRSSSATAASARCAGCRREVEVDPFAVRLRHQRWSAPGDLRPVTGGRLDRSLLVLIPHSGQPRRALKN